MMMHARVGCAGAANGRHGGGRAQGAVLPGGGGAAGGGTGQRAGRAPVPDTFEAIAAMIAGARPHALLPCKAHSLRVPCSAST